MFKKYDAYKDSELPSFGNVPNHWQVIPLCSITTLKSITNVVNEELLSVYLDKGVIRFDDVTEKRTNVTSLDLSKYQLVEEGDFVLNNQQAWRGSVGVSTYRGIVSPAYLVLKLSPKVDAKFANYFFRNSAMVSQYLINSKGVGTIQRNLYWQHLKRSNVVLPPTQEQTQIAEFLDHKTSEIDQAIAIKEQQIALLNERKQIVIQKAVTQGLNTNVPMKDSGVEWIGQIPEHWNTKKFKYAMSIKARLGWKGLKADEYVDNSEYGFLSTPNIKHQNIKYDECYFITQRRYEESPEIMLQDGDILLVKDGSTLGISNIVKNLPFKCTVNSSIAVLRKFQKEQYLPGFLNYYLKTSSIQNHIKLVKDGMGVPHLFQSDIKNFVLIIPPIIEQEQIIEFIEYEVEKIDAGISLIEDQIQKMKEYKTTLINDAVTGKIKVA